VCLLAGNVVTAVVVAACLNTADATMLRRLHPALASAVAAVPWADTTTPVCDTDRWRAALPAATALKLAEDALIPRGKELTALGGATELDLVDCCYVTDDVIARLPPTLRALNVSYPYQYGKLTRHANFTHLTALESLDCSRTKVLEAGLARLPPSLRELRMCGCELLGTAAFSNMQHLRVVVCSGWRAFGSATVATLPPSLEVLDLHYQVDSNTGNSDLWSPDLSHLARLRVINAASTNIDSVAIASLPPSLHVLGLDGCYELLLDISFAHLTCLHSLDLSNTYICNDTLATLPPSLVSLDLHHEYQDRSMLTPATVFPDLPALRVLNVSLTGIGDATIASMPRCLEELHLVCCHDVTQRASLGHLSALRVLQSAGTDLSPATIATCRASGCFAPADGKLPGMLKDEWDIIVMVPLPDGRLVSGAENGCVALWEADAERSAVPVAAELKLCKSYVSSLAVLHDGHRVAVGTSYGVVVWDTRKAPRDKQVVTRATIACDSGVWALAVLHNGWLVAGCFCEKLYVMDVDAGAVVATRAAHARQSVTAVAVLLDGRVASASNFGELKVWEVGAWTCVSLTKGYEDPIPISSLAVLPDGRLASASSDNTVRLWDTASGACIRVLVGHTRAIIKLAVLPNNQLASLSNNDGTIRVWDMRDDAFGAGGALARPPLVVEFRFVARLSTLLPLPDNRLLAGGSGGMHLWQLPPLSTELGWPLK